MSFMTQRQTIVFIAGLALGTAAAWAVFSRHAGAPEKVAQAHASPAAAKAAPVAPVSVAVGACAFAPVVATAAGDDGRVQVQADVTGRSAKDVDTWILDGKEAVAAGRQRDAEANFLMACRASEKLETGAVLPQAEAMYHLGRHYASLAGAATASRSGELWQRAEGLFAASFQIFNARYGDSSDKTRFAAKGLAEAREHASGAPAVAAAPVAPKAAEPKVAKAAAAPAKPPAPKVHEPAVAAVPPVPAKVPEQSVAVARPAPPKPRATPAPVSDESVVVEPPARATGQAQGQPADSTQ